MTKQISEHAHAAKLIRAELKKNGIKARVRASSYSGGSSVNVYLNDELPATRKAVAEYCDQFQMGDFDGMTDLYKYRSGNSDLPQVKFVFVENRISQEIYQAAWDYVRSHWGDMEGAPEDYEDAYRFNCRNGNGRDLVQREMREERGGFWKQYKQRVAA